MKNSIYLLYLLSSFLLLGCSEDFFDSIVEVKVPAHESNLAITAHLTNLDEVSVVHVTQTLGILDDQDAPPIKDATVELYSEGTLIHSYVYTELFTEPGDNGIDRIRDLYITREPKILDLNKTYELRVSTPTFGEIVATQPLLTPTKIIEGTFEEDGISGIFEDIEVDGEKQRAEEISITFQDKAGEKNYYAVEAVGFYDATFPVSPDITEYGAAFYLTPVDPATEEGLTALILSDATFDGKEYELKMAAFAENVADLKRVEVTLYTITEDRYLYEKTLINFEENDGNPFAEPVVIHENVSNGNGIFTMSAGDVYVIEF